MANIGAENVHKFHAVECPECLAEFKGLQTVFIQSRDGCCSLEIQSGVPLAQSSFSVLNTRVPRCPWPSGNRAREMVSFLIFSSFSQSEL